MKLFNHFIDYYVKFKTSPSYGEISRTYYGRTDYEHVYRMIKRMVDRGWLIKEENGYKPNPDALDSLLKQKAES